MNVAIVDDDELQLNNLNDTLLLAFKKLGIAVRKIDKFGSGEEFLSSYKARAYDIIILDIYMNEKNGVDVAKAVRLKDVNCALAFCTSSNEFASESYEVDASYYLQKPISEEKVLNMLKRFDLSKIERDRSVILPDNYRCILRQITYTEYQNHSVIFHLKNEKPHSVYMSHSEAEDLLLHYKNFKQINKGCIVNLAMVKKLSDNSFTMENGDSLPISRRRYKEIAEAYTKYHFERMEKEVDF